VSIAAIAKVKALVVAPNGEPLSAREKLLLLVLADYCNPETGLAWPSMRELARLSLMSERHARTMIRRLTRNGCLSCEHRHDPRNSERNMTNLYRILVGQPLPLGNDSLAAPATSGGGEIATSEEPEGRTVNEPEQNHHSIAQSNLPALPMKNGKEYRPSPQDVEHWQQTFSSGVEVVAELRKMRLWLQANPLKQKTRTGMLRFITGWLNRAKPSIAANTDYSVGFEGVLSRPAPAWMKGVSNED